MSSQEAVQDLAELQAHVAGLDAAVNVLSGGRFGALGSAVRCQGHAQDSWQDDTAATLQQAAELSAHTAAAVLKTARLLTPVSGG
jgi:hypothetical protein